MMKVENDSKSVGSIFRNLTTEQVGSFIIPIPDLPIQQAVVERIEQEQKLVDANRQLIALYEQKIKDRIAKIWKAE